MQIDTTIARVFAELEEALVQLEDREYTMPAPGIFNATIGQHVRHIIELFQCLLAGYDTGTVNYDRRKRDKAIETDKLLAAAYMKAIIADIDKRDIDIVLETTFGNDDEGVLIRSNFYRELVYNLEHTIHHMALIRVAINQLTDIVVQDSFGVAPSTIQHRKACVQ